MMELPMSHLPIYEERKINGEATCKVHLQVRSEGLLEVSKQPSGRFRRSKAPTGRFYTSPGQRPGFTATPIIEALKGRTKAWHRDWNAPSGLDFHFTSYPGRCPGLVWICPVGAQEGGAA